MLSGATVAILGITPIMFDTARASERQNDGMTDTRIIRYRGGPARVGALVQMLEEQGVHVDWEPPQEQRNLEGLAEIIVLSLVASGTYDGIKAAVAKFRKWAPRTEVILEESKQEDRLADEDVDAELKRRLDELANDDTATASRIAVCDAIGQALFHLGRVFWVAGYVTGSDRKSGMSPFGFGNDNAVGIATVTQIGGELSQGAAQLLKEGNLYAGAALIRQIVEVEYLARAFAAQHEKASIWLRADRTERLKFWSPARLRKGSRRFLASDYWNHCELGGHPTTRGMALLPDHVRINSALLWVDLAGHLSSIWKHTTQSAERLLGHPIPTDWKLPDVAAARDEWLRIDMYYAAIQHLGDILHGASDEDL
jgi:hypothetical protein